MERTILHCDCNAYFASVECISRPELKNVPMAVCGDPDSRHGIILAKNQLAKGFGVQTAETIWQAKKKCPNLVLVPSHHHLYMQVSQRINAIYGQYTDLVEPFSVDESWLDVTGCLHLFGTGADIADVLRRRIREEIGITISVGVSFNKVFAKLGSDYKKPDATTVITRDNYKALLWPLPAGDMLFVGKVAESRLLDADIRTIGDIARAGKDRLTALLGKTGETVYIYATGQDTSPVRRFDDLEKPKSLGTGTTFSRDLIGSADIYKGLLMLSDQVGTRLRQQGLFCQTVQVQMKDPNLKTISRQQRLSAPTNGTRELYEAAVEIVKRAWNMTAPVRMLTVTAGNLTDRCEEQMRLVDDGTEKRLKNARMDQAVDSIRSRFGNGAISFGSMLEKPEEKE